jgi:hypothetical protein
LAIKNAIFKIKRIQIQRRKMVTEPGLSSGGMVHTASKLEFVQWTGWKQLTAKECMHQKNVISHKKSS